MVKNITLQKLKEVIEKKGYRFFIGQYNLNIVGVRSLNSKSNSFDDLLIVAFKIADQWKMKVYPITTDPGKHWLNNPMTSGGTAILVPGQYPGCYVLGIHGRSHASGGYPALEQAKPMNYVRDNNKDEIVNIDLYRNPANVFSANLKTNIHRANSGWLSSLKKFFNVERHSAGCQVFQYADHFDEFLNICVTSKQYYGNSFTYTLLEEADFN